MLFKNTASQKLYVYACDKTTGVAQTGDAANITATWSKDGGAEAALTDTNPAEIGHGVYCFDLAQAETNCDSFACAPVSATSNILLNPVYGYTTGGAVPQAGVASQASLDTLDDYVDTEVAAIKAKTDNLPASPAATGDIPAVTAIHAEMDSNSVKLANLDAAISTRSTLVATEVWEAATRSLTDKTGFALTAAYDPAQTAAQAGDAMTLTAAYEAAKTAAQAATALTNVTWTDARAAKIDNLDATVSSRNATTPPTVTAIRQEIDANSTKLDAAMTTRAAAATALTNVTWTDARAGKLDNLDVAVSTRNATAPDNASITAIKNKTDNLPAAPAAVGDIPSAAAVATATLAEALAAESYAADGVVPTLSQVLYMLWSAVGDFSITGTTITCKKLDGTTTSMTFDLDSDTAPTRRTRST